MTDKLPSLARTRDAIQAFDAEGERFTSDAISELSYGEATAALDALDVLAEAVGVAYGHDTADRNNMDTCRKCVRPGPAFPQGGTDDLSFVRKMVAKWEKDSSSPADDR